MVSLVKIPAGTRVTFLGIDRGNALGRPYVLPGTTETVRDVLWDSTGRIQSEFIWALQPVPDKLSV